MSFGNFTPVHLQEIPANTLFKLKPEIRFESLPMLSPLYDGFTMRTKFYGIPIRLYIPELRKNRQQPWGSIPNFVFPYIEFNHLVPEDVSDTSVQFGHVSFAGSLLDMLGMCYGYVTENQSFNNRGLGTLLSTDTSRVNLLPLIAYVDCWLRGEYNPQDQYIPVLNEYVDMFNTTFTRRGYYTYLSYEELKNFVDYFAGFSGGPNFGDSIIENRLRDDLGGAGFLNMMFNSDSYVGNSILYDWPLFTLIGDYQNGEFVPMNLRNIHSLLFDNWSSFRNTTSNVGLLPTTYKGDYLSSWFNADGISRLEQYAITNGESFLSLRQRNADFMIDLLSTISGDRGTDYLQFIFDTYLELKDHPILLGWDEIHFGANEDTTSTTNSGEGSNGVLGAVASKARDYSNKVKPISFKTQEPLLFMVCSTIVPNVVYSQGMDRFMLKRTYSDLWHPQYDSRGFQRIDAEEYFNPYATSACNLGQFGGIFAQSLEANYVAPFVPLGWEYMQHKSTVKGGMKTQRYRTWSNIREFDFLGTQFGTRDAVEFDNQLLYINPLTNDYVDSNGEFIEGMSGDPNTLFFTSLMGTYVIGIPYNMPFANVDAFDNQNFVVNYGFIVSQYQPITHNLITKTF